MLRLLLDADSTPRVAQQVRRHRPRCAIESVHHWQEGRYLEAADDVILAAYEAGMTLLTYDRRTITPLLRDWARQGRPHAGVIFVDERSIAQSDVGGLVRAIINLWDTDGDLDWLGREHYLRPSGDPG